jgi:transcriptional regulator with XRE-family HTH domain
MAAQQQGGGVGQGSREDRWVDDSIARNTDEFRALLKRHREARRWSQERLASESEMDHSLVSRLESGQRSPTREAIGKLARGLDLPTEQKDRLLIAAGFFPEQPENALADEPAVTRIYRILRDEQTPQPVRDNIRALLNSLTEIALAS